MIIPEDFDTPPNSIRSELRESPEFDPDFRKHKLPWWVYVLVGLFIGQFTHQLLRALGWL